MSLGDVLSLIGLVVSIVGFVLALQQLRRTAKATEATRLAIEETGRRMSLNHLLVLLPQLRTIEADLDVAIVDDDRRLAIRTLVTYSHTAMQVAALLEGESAQQHGDLVSNLRDSAKVAGAAKSNLVTNNRPTVRVASKAAALRISEVVGVAAGLVPGFQVKAG